MPGIRDAILDAIALLLPVECAGCGRSDRPLCADCAIQLLPAVTPRVLPDGTPLFTAVLYEGVVRRVILELKEHQRTDVAALLARPFAAAVLAATLASATPGSAMASRGSASRGSASRGPAELLAVPSSRAAFGRRGYDPVALLVRHSGHRSVRAFRTPGASRQQKLLGAVERAVNREGTMAAKRSLDGRRFILLDDVVTSGATMVEAARAVRGAGGIVSAAAALAFTPRLFAAGSSSF